MGKEQIKKVARLMIESGCTKDMKEAMREAGYPETTSTNPQKIAKSKTYLEALAAVGIDQDFKATKLKELILDEKKVKVYDKQGNIVKEITEKGSQAGKGLEMVHRIFGDYAPEKRELSGTLNVGQLLDEVDE